MTDEWPRFTTSNGCDAPDDCSSDIVYKLERYGCNSCHASSNCDVNCENWYEVPASEGSISNNTNNFRFTSVAQTNINTLDNYKVRIKACIGTNCGYSDQFDWIQDASSKCSECYFSNWAQIRWQDGVLAGKPDIEYNKPGGVKSDNSAKNTDVSNTICPKFCPGGETCGDPSFEVLCRDAALSHAVPHAVPTLFSVTLQYGEPDPAEYFGYAFTDNLLALEKTFNCKIEATLTPPDGSYTKV